MAWAYDTTSENFAISYLKHEAQHLVDLERFPQMGSAELEYRAKLTELAFANQSLKRVLDDFAAKAAPNPESAHALANWRINREIYRGLNGVDMPDNWSGWGYVDAAKINRLARDLLMQHTRTWERL